MGKLKSVLVGDYDWKFLCTPRLPWGGAKPPPPLFRKDDPISLFVAIAMGAQHALAMVGGIITVPLIIGGSFVGNFNPSTQVYLISAALIVSGISSFIQVTQIKIPYSNYVIGSGLLSVMGISFTFLPIAQSVLSFERACFCDGKPCSVGYVDTCKLCTGTLSGTCHTGDDAYGKLLGTLLLCCWLEIGLSMCPPKLLRRLFPPVVTGTTVVLIGFSLTRTGFAYWGGGVYCSSQVLTSQALCDGNGEVLLPFGSRQYLGLGLSVFMTLLLVELFGSPFLRNVQVVVGLAVGMIVASATTHKLCESVCEPQSCVSQCFQLLPLGVSYNNATNSITGSPTLFSPNSTTCANICTPAVPSCTNTCKDASYVTSTDISRAKWVTFLWRETFDIGFYAPAVLPALFGFMVTTMECIGDVTATTEASGLIPAGSKYEQSVQGGVLADGLCCFFSALATMLPCTTYAQNNGVISLTRCGARRAGWACAVILVALGIFAKVAGAILSIPDCVLGGMTTFLFINVSVSGMRILTMGEGITRRNRYIIAMALAIGVGVELVPEWVNITGHTPTRATSGLSRTAGAPGFRDAIIIVLSTGFSIGGFIALILNLILPYDTEDAEDMEVQSSLDASQRGLDAKAAPIMEPMHRDEV
eukprot:jgi/Mesen1/10832/ME000093S10348